VSVAVGMSVGTADSVSVGMAVGDGVSVGRDVSVQVAVGTVVSVAVGRGMSIGGSSTAGVAVSSWPWLWVAGSMTTASITPMKTNIIHARVGRIRTGVIRRRLSLTRHVYNKSLENDVGVCKRDIHSNRAEMISAYLHDTLTDRV
jgi:hypothetical protein